MNSYPELLLLFSGKRKSGKDYICEKLKKLLGDKDVTIVRISSHLKKIYAEQHHLDLNELMSESSYKENYRISMIEWSDKIRAEDSGYFCKFACNLANKTKIWIVSDVRRKTDIQWFKDNYQNKMKTIRISADESVRIRRGYQFTKGVDDVCSECDLDDYTEWDYQIMNNNDDELAIQIENLLLMVNGIIRK